MGPSGPPGENARVSAAALSDRRLLPEVRRLVVKVGSSSLTDADGRLDP